MTDSDALAFWADGYGALLGRFMALTERQDITDEVKVLAIREACKEALFSLGYSNGEDKGVKEAIAFIDRVKG